MLTYADVMASTGVAKQWYSWTRVPRGKKGLETLVSGKIPIWAYLFDKYCNTLIIYSFRNNCPCFLNKINIVLQVRNRRSMIGKEANYTSGKENIFLGSVITILSTPKTFQIFSQWDLQFQIIQSWTTKLK